MGENTLQVAYSLNWPRPYVVMGSQKRAINALVAYIRGFGFQAKPIGVHDDSFIVTREGRKIIFVVSPATIVGENRNPKLPYWVANSIHWPGHFAVRAESMSEAILVLGTNVTALGFDCTASAKRDFLGREKLVVNWEGHRIIFDIFATEQPTVCKR